MSNTAAAQQTHLATLFGEFFRNIYDYREYLKQSILRDLRTKYKRSALGYVWAMLHPLGMMVILAVVFSQVMRIPVKDYAVFLFAGLLPWNFFQGTVMLALGSIRHNHKLFGQIAVPKYIFIISLCFSNLFNYLLALLPLLLIILVCGRPLDPTMLLFPIIVLPLVLVTLGVSLLLSASSVFFDDTQHLADVALQGLYFASPVLYHRELLPEWLIKYLVINPVFCQLEFIRGIFYDGKLPELLPFLVNTSGSVLVFVFGLWIFKKSEDKFLYHI